MTYAVYAIEKFNKEMAKFSEEEQRRIKIIFLQLKENPYVGDQIWYRHFREKRLREKRIYYLIYDDLQTVLVVAISDKKTQQETINQIVGYFDEYRFYITNLLKKD